MRVKKAADVYLTATDLDWVVVRPGTLTDGPGTGHVNAGWAVPYGDVARDDVAAFIAAALREPRLRRVVVELTDGAHPGRRRRRRAARLGAVTPSSPRRRPRRAGCRRCAAPGRGRRR